MKCIFCDNKITHGNNSAPLKDKPCCDLCNLRIVIPARLAVARNEKPRVRLNYMSGEPQMPEGLEGTINMVDDIGQIHVNWDNRSTLALNAKMDIFSVL